MASDLHTHTNFSDGFYSPQELVNQAEKIGLSYLSITDHDTINGIENLSHNNNLQLIPGVEISVQHPEPSKELHILGLNVDINNKYFSNKLNELSLLRHKRIEKIICLLNELGYKISVQDVFNSVGEKNILVRNHLAVTLADKNYFPTSKDAYNTLLRSGKPAYVPLKKLSVDETIQLIHSAGGIAVLAHPKLVQNDDLVDAVAEKVDGIEIFYPHHSFMDQQKYLEIAQKYNLKISGGSDFHGTPGDKAHPKIFGEFTIPDEFAKNLFE